MRIKQLILIAFCGLLIFSCKEEVTTRVTQAYRSGAKKREVDYSKEGKIGIAQRVYQEDGKLLMEGPLKDQLRNGEWSFYDYEGKLKSIREYAVGTYNGKYTEYHSNGKVSIQGTYTNGKRTGEWKKFDESGKEIKDKENTEETPTRPDFRNEKVLDSHPNGNVKTKVVYDETGTNEIAQKTYYPDGKIQVNGAMKDGKRDGKWTAYTNTGRVLSVNYYLEGEYHGDYMLYHENGIIKIEGEYNFGVQTGSWKGYDTDGTLLSHSFYDADGNLMDKIK